MQKPVGSGMETVAWDAVRRRFDVAMVWSVDRLGRSLADLIGSMQELRDAKIDLMSVAQFDLPGPLV